MKKIIEIVEEVTSTPFASMRDRKPLTNVFARYTAMLMMREEGVCNIKIATLFGYQRSNITHTFNTIANLLETNKTFKTMYLACIARLAQLEDAA
jgi:hypothetical protein